MDKGASDDIDAWLRKKGKMKKKKKSRVEWRVNKRGSVVVDEVDIVHNLGVGYHESIGVIVEHPDVVGVKIILMRPANGVRQGDTLELLLPD